jgi:acetoin utilization deacetylase AcuC-like enzyme
LKVIFAQEQLKHFPESYLSSGAPIENPEQPERAKRLLSAATASGLHQDSPPDYGNDVIASVHTARYIDFLQNIYTRWSRMDGASKEVVPNVHPISREDGYPKSAVGQVGYHVYDASCPISEDTWLSARWSAMTAAHAARQVAAGDDACFALCRPPGHHASQDIAGGFCYLNNSAIAAQQLRSKHQRVAILDVDVHHGNGTQRIFYERSDVLTVSLHADPVRFYPFFWGYENETGAGAGTGFNRNLPLPRGTSDAEYLPVLHDALETISDFAPDALVVALGLDAHEDDPYRGMAITTAGFGQIAEIIGQLGLPTVLVQEGGYLSDALGANLSAFLDGFRAVR